MQVGVFTIAIKKHCTVVNHVCIYYMYIVHVLCSGLISVGHT